jgi:type IV secretion system protein TrbJ
LGVDGEHFVQEGRVKQAMNRMARGLMIAALAAGGVVCSGVNNRAAAIVCANCAQEVTHLMVLAQEVEQVAKTIAMLEANLRMLASIGVNSVADIPGAMSRVRSALGSIDRELYDLGTSDAEYRRRYPDAFPGQPLPELYEINGQWRGYVRNAVNESWRVQNNSVANQAVIEQRTGNLVALSQSAEGQTAAIQASNQLLAQVIESLGGINGQLTSHSRAMETFIAAQVTDPERQKAERDELYRDWPKPNIRR